MGHLFVYGAATATVLFSQNMMILYCAVTLLFAAIAFNGKKEDVHCRRKRPEVMLRLWIEQKARADAWSGMPWEEEKMTELRNEIRWQENFGQNWADNVESQRKKSLFWLLINKLFRVSLRPTLYMSEAALYKNELIRQIKQAELEQRRLNRD
jgi:hypothetical protein